MNDMIICIKGAGEIASAIAWRLYMSNIRKIVMLDLPAPMAIRRFVCFSQAVYDKTHTVEMVEAVLCEKIEDIRQCWRRGAIAVAVDPNWALVKQLPGKVVIDAILAKKNLGTTMDEAALVIGLGPGFVAQKDVHMVVETNRGHNLGRIILSGTAEANTGVPGSIGGHTEDRVLRAPADGRFTAYRKIGDLLAKNDIVGSVGKTEVVAGIAGALRGIYPSGNDVHTGLKIGDIDPRGQADYCYTISDKGRTISGAVLEAVLRVFPP